MVDLISRPGSHKLNNKQTEEKSPIGVERSQGSLTSAVGGTDYRTIYLVKGLAESQTYISIQTVITYSTSNSNPKCFLPV